jgi:RES domain-containing protein
MKLWRISNDTDLSGIGGLKFAARWHSKGKAIVYTAEHPALALLEILVNGQQSNLPDTYTLLELEVPDATEIERISKLESGWHLDESYTRNLGDKWLASKATPLLRVPSAVMPRAFNYLINPSHKISEHIKIVGHDIHQTDQRLK